MANLDTAAKRRAAVQFQPWMVLPDADGAISSADRGQAAGVYSGITFIAAPVILSNLKIMSLALDPQLSMSISYSGDNLPMDLASGLPTTAPASGKGLASYLSGDDLLLAAWDSDTSTWKKTNFNDLVSSSSGELRIGGASNYTAIEADGTIEFNGDATVWDDLRVVPGSFDRPGVSDPTIVAYNVNGGGVSTYLWQFAKDNVAAFTVQLPHGYKQGSDVYVHIHWTPGPRGNEESGNLVGWKIDYSWANIDGAFGTMATVDLSDACDGTDHKHQMTPDVAITGTSKNISSMLICNVKRTDTTADDTWVGTASGERPMLLEIDFHFELDMVASRQRTSKS